MHSRRATILLVTAFSIAVLLVLTGVSLVRIQTGYRSALQERTVLQEIEWCARSAMEWAYWRTTHDAASYTLDNLMWYQLPAIDPDHSVNWMDADLPNGCTTLITASVITDDIARVPLWPPEYDSYQERLYMPVSIVAFAKKDNRSVGYESWLYPLHPAVEYAIFADEEIHITGQTKLTTQPLLRTNGYFSKPQSGGSQLQIGQFGTSPDRMLERPANYNHRIHDFNQGFWRYSLPYDRDDLENTYPQIIKSGHDWIAYPSLDGLEPDGPLSTTFWEDAQDVRLLSDLASKAVDCVPTRDDACYGDLNGLTVLTGVHLRGKFSLDAQGGPVLISNCMIEGSLLVHNLGTDPNGPWDSVLDPNILPGGLLYPLTIDEGVVMKPQVGVDAPVLVVFADDTQPVPTDRNPPEVLLNLSSDLDPGQLLECNALTATCTDRVHTSEPASITGLIVTDRGTMEIRGDTSKPIVETTLITGRVDLYDVEIRKHDSVQFRGSLSEIPGLVFEEPKLMPGSWRSLTEAELEYYEDIEWY